MRVLSHARAGTIVCMERPIDQTESPLEIFRRLENIVRAGTIAAVRLGRPARCRVRSGEITTNWIPWHAGRAGGNGGRQWWPPVVGEQCLLVSPGGDLLNAVAIPGVYSDANAQGSESATACRTDWSATDFMEHDSATGRLVINCREGIELRVQGATLVITPDAITLQADGGAASLTGSGWTATPDVVSGSISLVHHVHGGVKRDDAKTDGPE